MDWLADTAARRADPATLWPERRSIVMLGVNYGPDGDPLAALDAEKRGDISVYARDRDYHDVHQGAPEAARALAGRRRAGGTAEVKVFVDTAPVMEKPLAQAAGLGWQGKHTNLVSREFGSWLFLGAIFTTLELPPDAPESDHCGQCRACLDICPTAAFPQPYRLDARRCISYLTIEHKGHIAARLPRSHRQPHLWLRRLPRRVPVEQIRQQVAPRSKLPAARRAARAAACRAAAPRRCRLSARCLPEDPVKRIGRDRFMRNVLIAIGNSGDAALADPVAERGSTTPRRWCAAWRCGRSPASRRPASRRQRQTLPASRTPPCGGSGTWRSGR